MNPLTGWRLWGSLGAVALAGVGVGSFARGWSNARGLTVEASADAGASSAADAGARAECECVTDVQWRTVQVPVPGPTRYVRGDAGLVEVHTVETVAVLVPDLRLSNHSAASSEGAGLGVASAAAAARVAAPEPGLSLLWGVGGGVQHDTAYQPTLGGYLGLQWGHGSSVRLSGAVAPLQTQSWNALLTYGGAL